MMTTPKRNDSGGLKYTELSSAGKTLGQKGGKSTSPAKETASRTHGGLGGRPTKR